MNSPYRLLLCGLGLILAIAPAAGVEPSPARSGRVLLLDNGRALEGEIREENGTYCVRRAGGEVRLTSDKVLALCATWEEAFTAIRGRANLRDPEEHLRLARWCQSYGLKTQALAEATAALQMRPSHAESRQLLTLLQRNSSSSENTAAAKPVARTPAPAVPAIDLSVESLGAFTTRVQPVLMNTCASCHAGSATSSFRLMRPSGNSAASRRATQQNMAAVLAWIDPKQPGASPLLMRAVTDHGKSGEAPLKAQSPPYRILHEWIQFTLATNPFLREQGIALAKTTTSATTDNVPRTPEAKSADPASAETVRNDSAPVISRPMSAATPRTLAPSSPAPITAAPLDDFDPAQFNRQFHQPGTASGGR